MHIWNATSLDVVDHYQLMDTLSITLEIDHLIKHETLNVNVLRIGIKKTLSFDSERTVFGCS